MAVHPLSSFRAGMEGGLESVNDLSAVIDREAFVRKLGGDVASKTFEGVPCMGLACQRVPVPDCTA